ncbi:MAG: type IV secretion system DNA-binding domain-containing protein [bacterium]
MNEVEKKDLILFAETNFRNQKRKFGIKTDDRRRHMYLIGKTGMGKSTVLENMIIQDIRAGRGLAVVDPHGDLVEKVIDFIPDSRINDVIYFNPADFEYPIAFNPLESVDPEHQHLIASGIVGVFKKLFAESWGPRLEYLLRNAILALLDYPGSTLLGIMRILIDKAYRQKVIAKIKDPVVKSFWRDEFSKYHDRFLVEAIAPIQNKVGQFLSSFLIRNIIGQVKSTIDVRKIMDEKKVLLLNLSKGRVGEDNSQLLGAMLITKIQLAAMERVNVPEKERADFYLYVDEFQNFATESFVNILSEARKYRLNLILANQYIEQLADTVRAAIFGNVGSMLVFRIGAADAEELVKEFEPQFTEEDLVNLTKYDIYLKLMIDGMSSNAFSATTLPPLVGGTENREKVIRVSRERYATKRDVIEDKIARWTDMDNEAEEPARSQPTFNRPFQKKTFQTELPERPRQQFERPASPVRLPRGTAGQGGPTPPDHYKVICDMCDQEAIIRFKPDPNRPVYCRDCLQKIKEGALPKLQKVNQEEKEAPGLSLKDALVKGPTAFVRQQRVKKEPSSSFDQEQKLKPGEIAKF